MNKTILGVSMALLLTGSVVFAGESETQKWFGNNCTNGHKEPKGLEAIICNLRDRVLALEARAPIPGPKGDRGPAGPKGDKGDIGPAGPQGSPGSPSWDDARIAALEARVAALEPPPPPPVCTAIVCDDFNGYTPGSIVGQGAWINYTNGSNFSVQSSTTYEGANALFVNSLADNVVTKNGTPLSGGTQAVYVRTKDRANWGSNVDGNAQVRVSKGEWAAGTDIFAAVSFRSDGNVAFYNITSGVYENFSTYNDNEWTLLEIQWRSSDKMARYRINGGVWTAWNTFKGSGSFTNFDNVGFDFVQPSGSGGVYFDTLK